jgi:hypothetical protein
MALYLVSYDIPGRNESEYQALWDYLASLGGVKILFSEYAVPFNEGSLALANKIIKTHLKPGDRLLVCELFGGEPTSWLNLMISTEAFSKMLSSHARTLK